MSAQGIKAGKAFVEVSADGSLLNRGLKASGDAVKAFGSAVVTSAKAGSVAMAAIGATAVAAATRFAETGAKIAQMAARTGASAESLQTLGYAARQAGGEMGDVESALTSIRGKLYEAQMGSGDAMMAFARLGLSVSDLARMSPEDQFRAIAAALQKIPNAAQRAAFAEQTLGSANLVPILGQMEALEKQANTLGIAMTTAEAKGAARFNAALGDLGSVIGRIASQIGAALAPVLEEVVTVMSDIASEISSGNISGAAEIAWAALKAIWLQGVAWIYDKTSGAFKGVAGYLFDVFAGIQTAWVEVSTGLVKAWLKAMGAVQSGMATAQNKIAHGILEIWALFDKTLDVADAHANLDQDTARRKTEIDAATAQGLQQAESNKAARLKAIDQSAEANKSFTSDVVDDIVGGTSEAAKKALQGFRESLKKSREERSNREAETAKAMPAGELIGRSTSTAGTFSAIGAARGMGGNKALSEISKATAATAKHTQTIANKSGGMAVT